MYTQKKDILVYMGVDPEMVEKRMAQQKILLQAIKEQKSKEIMKAILTDVINLDMPGIPIEDLNAVVEEHLVGLVSVPMRDLIQYDPTEVLSKLTVPTLAIFGEKDTQVVSSTNEKGMKEIFDASGNQHAETVIIPGMNHIFQPAQTGQVFEYQTIKVTAMPLFLEKISIWIVAQK
jgi:pimeloyl-ACP methyl ester carboxylesterase